MFQLEPEVFLAAPNVLDNYCFLVAPSAILLFLFRYEHIHMVCICTTR